MNTIKYEEEKEYFPNLLVSAKSMIPQWYKDIKTYPDGKVTIRQNIVNMIKLCMPFFDSLKSGYLILLPVDVIVEGPVDNKRFTWRGIDEPVKYRGINEKETFPVPSGHSRQHFAWNSSIALNINSKYSFILSHPFNRFDLPFTTLTGIVDGGFDLPSGNIPFFVKNDFEGIIPQGTPIAQIIPFKRENWKLIKQLGLFKKSTINKHKTELVISGWYKKTFWQKKEYRDK